MNDRFAFIVGLCRLSSSQEEILLHRPFARHLPDDGAATSPGGVPMASTDIATETLPETAQDAGKDRSSQDDFHTPPEQQSSLSSSDFHHCVMHNAVQTDDETQVFVDSSEYVEAAEFVDLSDDSELGFPQVKLKQTIDPKVVADCSSGNDGARVGENSNGEIDKFRLSKRELSSKDSLSESPHKTTKHSEQNPGFESLQASLGIEPQKIRDDLENCERKSVSNHKSPCNFGAYPQHQQNVQIGKEMCLGVGEKENAFEGILVEKNSGSFENPGKFNLDDTEECVENSESREGICEAEKLPCTGEGDGKTVHGVSETSKMRKGGDKQQELRVLPSSIRERLGNDVKEKEKNGKGNSFVFDVLKALNKGNSEGDSYENVSWLQLMKTRGFNVPRPFWRKEEDNKKN